MDSKPGSPQKRKRLYEHRIRLFSTLLASPFAIVSLAFIVNTSWTPQSKTIVIVLLLLLWLILEAALHDQIIRPLQTLTNVVASLREDDFSFRARGSDPEDALGELALEVNTLADALALQRSSALEASELLKRVVEEIDVPLYTFDPQGALRFVNAAGATLLQRSPGELLGRTSDVIGLEPYLQGEASTVAAAGSRWLVRRRSFRERGVPHTLIILADVSHALREEERTAWQRLIRVLGHELSNSLTPIKSIAGSLRERASSLPAGVVTHDFEKGLHIIETRAAALHRFIQGYRQLAQLPTPSLRSTDLRSLIERSAGLELRLPVTLVGGPDTTVQVDPDQIEQLLINLIRNAADAALLRSTKEAAVDIRWALNGSSVAVDVMDNGDGLLNPENAFVPFYTTKPAGSGIGLVLSRQIAEAHAGSVVLRNREGTQGCIASLKLPIRGTTP